MQSTAPADDADSVPIWSNTDYPYMCLKDETRTLAFRDAIRAVVRPGDVVVDVGAGSGILSFFAAEAGAGQVYAVEIDPVSAAALRRSVALNPAVAGRVTVVEGDAAVVPLPGAVDVVVAEIIETGLLDEQQVPVLNALRRRGVIGPTTRMVPAGYVTTLQLVCADHRYYGFEIAAPKHEWPFYTGPGWHATRVQPASDPVTVACVDFAGGPIDEHVHGAVEVDVEPAWPVNAVRLAGRIDLAPGCALGPSHAVNGDKVLPIDAVAGASRILLRWRFRMGAGLGALELSCQAIGASARASGPERSARARR